MLKLSLLVIKNCHKFVDQVFTFMLMINEQVMRGFVSFVQHHTTKDKEKFDSLNRSEFGLEFSQFI